MSKKKLTLLTLLALSSLFNPAYALEKKESSWNSRNVISHVAAFGIGGGLGFLGNKYLHSDPVIKEKDKTIVEKEKTIVEKDKAVNDWEEKYKKLKEENKELVKENYRLINKNSELKHKSPNGYYSRLVANSEADNFLKFHNQNSSEDEIYRQMKKWMLTGRCLEQCVGHVFGKGSLKPARNSGGLWLGCDNLVLYTNYASSGPDQTHFSQIFKGEDPVTNFDSLSTKHKQEFIETAVKALAILSSLNCSRSEESWEQIQKSQSYSYFNEFIHKEWPKVEK